ncbi:hypothetical protein LguiA_008325 [Lonicera macranthoides]
MGEEKGMNPTYKILSPWTNRETKGGFTASYFIYGLVALDNMGFIAIVVSMVLYFFLDLHFNIANSANTLTNLMGSTFLLALLGGFISDTYINRFHTCLIFGAIEIVGLILMTIQARFTSLQPPACGIGKPSCIEGGLAVMFYLSLCLFALGSGGVRGALPALGADQFDQKDPREAKALGTYFNLLLLATTSSACLGVTVIVWISTNKGWWYGFLIFLISLSVGFFVLALGKPFYRLKFPEYSPLFRITEVIVVAFKNRKLSLPESPSELYEINEKESVSEPKILHTDQFSWLDKAAVPCSDPIQATPWTLCTVTQVEEVKVLTRMLPIIASTILMNTCLAQLQTFSVQQGRVMNRFLRSFEVPAASVPVIPLAFMSILLPLYELFFVPFARKITKHPSGITQLQRVGVGLVLSAISMAIAGIVEVKRKNHFIDHPTEKAISLFWLSFQYGIFGIADMFTLVGLLEFFYREAPAGMRSLSTSFTWLSLSFGYFLSSVFVDVINAVTKRVAPSKLGWLHGEDLNSNNLDLFYWFLAILSVLNFFNYLYWASWYTYKPQEDGGGEVKLGGPLSGAQDELSKPTNGESGAQDELSKPTNGESGAQDDVSKPTNGESGAQDNVSKPTNGESSIEPIESVKAQEEQVGETFTQKQE